MRIIDRMAAVLVCAIACAGVHAQGTELRETELRAVMAASGREELENLVRRLETSSGPDKALYLGIAYHNLARIDPKAWAEKAVSTLAAYSGEYRKGLALAYRGSAVTLVASTRADKGDVIGASMRLNEGFSLIDRAVALEPNDMAIRLLRAENGLEISETTPFKRWKEIRADVDFLAARAASFDGPLAASYHLIVARLAIAERRVRDALRELDAAVAAAPDSPAGIRARALLDDLEG